MKAFDLAAAKAGAPVCTRDGEKARVFAIDANTIYNDFVQPVVAEYIGPEGGYYIGAFCADGSILNPRERSSKDLMMRDDDYAEKLARGEYGPTIKENLTVDTPTCKESLPVDREYWRRVYAGMAMQGIFAGRNWNKDRIIPDCIGHARNAVELADALIAELEKK